MQPQLILRIAGIVALVIALLFAVLAVHYYLSQHIKAVMDDLSGKARAQGVAQARGASRTGGRAVGARHEVHPSAAAPASAPQAVRTASVAAAPSPEPAGQAFAATFGDEDESGTVLVAATHAAAGAGQVAGEDDIATMVDAGAWGASDEDDLATMVAAGDQTALGEDDLATMVASADDDAAAPVATSFRLTKRIVLIHSQEIIATSEEPLA